MKNSKPFHILFFMLAFLVINAVKSQFNPENLEFHSVEKNLFQRPITAMVKDAKGFIWIGTDGGGLYKYNGSSYSYYGHNLEDNNTVNSNSISSLFVASNGKLWVGTNAGLCVYDDNKNTFERIGTSTENTFQTNYTNVLCFAEFENKLIIGTYDGVKKINVTQGTIGNYSLSGNAILDMKFSSNGNLYIATDKGLKLEEYHQKGTIQEVSIASNRQQLHITKLHLDKKENLWVGTLVHGVFKTDLKKSRKVFTKLNIANKKTMAITSGNDYVFIAIENEGIVIVDSNGKVIESLKYNAEDKYSIESDSVWSLLLDDQSRLWLGYYENGLGFFDQYHTKFKAIQRQSSKNSLQTNDIRAFAKTDEETIWIAQTNAIDILNSTTGEITPIYRGSKFNYKGLKKGIFIEDIFVDSKGNLWIASWGDGVFLLKKDSQTFINFSKENTPNGLLTNKVQCFTEDSKGRVWIGSFLNGIFYFDPLTQTIKQPNSESYAKSELLNKDIKVIYHDSNGYIWVGTSSGLYHVNTINEEDMNIVGHNNAISSKFGGHPSSKQIIDIYETQDGTVWCGTNGGGLFSYNRETTAFERFELEGQDLTYVNAIFEPVKNELWLSSKLGILKVERESKKVTKFTLHDGLLKNFVIDRAVILDGNNTLYLGTKNGINTINPQSILHNPYPAKPYLKAVRIFNKQINPRDDKSPLKVDNDITKIALKHDQTVLTIDYEAISYTRSENNQYAYYLENFEEKWNYVGAQTSATYTNLEPGDYIFKLKASNNDNLWNEPSTILKIEVLPPWWKTIWAYLAYALIILFLIASLSLLYKTRVEEKNKLKLERERRKQKVELQQQKLQFFTNISHEFRTPLTLIINPIKELLELNQKDFPQPVREKHHIIHKNAERLSRLINELMDFRKIQSNKLQLNLTEFKLVNQTKNILSFFNEEAKRRAIRLDLKYENTNLEVFADKGILDKIFFNLLSNAFKVTPNEGRVQVIITSSENKILPAIHKTNPIPVIEISVKDNGPGIDQKEYKKIFKRFYQISELNKSYYGSTGIGLEMVKSFVELHKGIIEIDSTLGKGSTFKIVIPNGKEYFIKQEEFSSTKYLESASTSLNSESVPYNISELLKSKVVKKKMLITEDNVDLQDYLVSIFKDKYDLALAADGQEGWLKTMEHVPDIIITDVIMPLMDGIAFSSKVKNDPNLRHIPIVMLTAKSSTTEKIKGMEAGVEAYLVKPFDKKELTVTVEQLLIKNSYSKPNKTKVPLATKEKATVAIDNDFMQKVVNFIHEHLDNPALNVELLSSHLCLSRSQVYRKVKHLTGLSPIAFIRRIRLERSRTMFENDTNLNVSEVAHQVGFLSASYFTVCYKKQFGELPKKK